MRLEDLVDCVFGGFIGGYFFLSNDEILVRGIGVTGYLSVLSIGLKRVNIVLELVFRGFERWEEFRE